MALFISVILVSVIVLLSVSLFLFIRFRKSKLNETPDKAVMLSCNCKVCNTYVAFGADQPVPQVWQCPACKSRNYTQPG